jgi:hypothetical protein
VYKNCGDDETDVWARADLLRKFACLGVKADHGSKCSHSMEAFYGFGDKTKTLGLKSSPFWLRLNARYVLSDQSRVVSNYIIGSHFEKNTRYTHKLDDHWTMGVHYHNDTRRKAQGRSNHDFGYSLEYNC